MTKVFFASSLLFLSISLSPLQAQEIQRFPDPTSLEAQKKGSGVPAKTSGSGERPERLARGYSEEWGGSATGNQPFLNALHLSPNTIRVVELDQGKVYYVAVRGEQSPSLRFFTVNYKDKTVIESTPVPTKAMFRIIASQRRDDGQTFCSYYDMNLAEVGGYNAVTSLLRRGNWQEIEQSRYLFGQGPEGSILKWTAGLDGLTTKNLVRLKNFMSGQQQPDSDLSSGEEPRGHSPSLAVQKKSGSKEGGTEQALAEIRTEIGLPSLQNSVGPSLKRQGTENPGAFTIYDPIIKEHHLIIDPQNYGSTMGPGPEGRVTRATRRGLPIWLAGTGIASYLLQKSLFPGAPEAAFLTAVGSLGAGAAFASVVLFAANPTDRQGFFNKALLLGVGGATCAAILCRLKMGI